MLSVPSPVPRCKLGREWEKAKMLHSIRLAAFSCAIMSPSSICAQMSMFRIELPGAMN